MDDKKNLRGSVYKIFEKWYDFKEPMRDNFNITMSQASKVIKEQDVTVHQDY